MTVRRTGPAMQGTMSLGDVTCRCHLAMSLGDRRGHAGAPVVRPIAPMRHGGPRRLFFASMANRLSFARRNRANEIARNCAYAASVPSGRRREECRVAGSVGLRIERLSSAIAALRTANLPRWNRANPLPVVSPTLAMPANRRDMQSKKGPPQWSTASL